MPPSIRGNVFYLIIDSYTEETRIMSPAGFPNNFEESEITVDRQNWDSNGFIVLRNFFGRSEVDCINDYIDRFWATRSLLTSSVTIDANLESPQQERMRFSSAPAELRQSPYKLNDLYLESEEIRSIVLNERLCLILSSLLGGNPMICNTLNFECGSQQTFHTDTLYMTPRVENKLIVTWIALDEVDDNNGPIEYYPGSHQIPAYKFENGEMHASGPEMAVYNTYMEKQLANKGICSEKFLASPGGVLIWHAQLLHGGSQILDASRLRRSLVTHYFRKQDYRHRFWHVKKSDSGGYYYSRKHPTC